MQLRPEGTVNTKLVTGKIEVLAARAGHYSHSESLPFEVTKSTETNEELRMKYRYLDLRNPAVQKNLFVRHQVYQSIRCALDAEKFIEVETPILTKSTPEGARDYLVPSRMNPGEFYALPQSPQLFKQILMVSGFDRYFQIAKCFRDEDLRADRQPEFTQLDMEMSFVKEEDIFSVVEKVAKNIFKDVLGKDLPTPFQRLTYQEAMATYGTDKPDLRFEVKIQDMTLLAKQSTMDLFRNADTILAMCLPWGNPSRKDIDDLDTFVKAEGAGGLPYLKVTPPAAASQDIPREHLQLTSPIAKFFSESLQKQIIKDLNAHDGDLIVCAIGDRKKSQKILGSLRLHVSKLKGLAKSDTFHFSWITDFPLFQRNEEEKRWDSEHHPFTSPHMEDWNKHKASGELEKIRSSAYDLVLNGNEIASGSIRIHDRALQREIFKTIGLDEKEAESRFGFLLKAFEFGPPPHGGIALGIDRVITILLGLTSIREVIAFPKNQKAADPMTDAPSGVAEKQLKELGIRIR